MKEVEWDDQRAGGVVASLEDHSGREEGRPMSADICGWEKPLAAESASRSYSTGD